MFVIKFSYMFVICSLCAFSCLEARTHFFDHFDSPIFGVSVISQRISSTQSWVHDCVFNGLVHSGSGGNGGAIEFSPNIPFKLVVENSVFIYCQAGYSGGGIYFYSSSSSGSECVLSNLYASRCMCSIYSTSNHYGDGQFSYIGTDYKGKNCYYGVSVMFSDPEPNTFCGHGAQRINYGKVIYQNNNLSYNNAWETSGVIFEQTSIDSNTIDNLISFTTFAHNQAYQYNCLKYLYSKFLNSYVNYVNNTELATDAVNHGMIISMSGAKVRFEKCIFDLVDNTGDFSFLFKRELTTSAELSIIDCWLPSGIKFVEAGIVNAKEATSTYAITHFSTQIQ